MSSDKVAERLEAFVRAQFAVSPDDPGFGRAVDLFEHGYMDSLGFAELIAFLGQEFGVDVPEDDLLSDEFSSIEGMAGIVSRLTRETSDEFR